MTLKEVCELADACGLGTVGEAVMNAELHYDALVTISDMDKEFEELYREVRALGTDWEDVSIYTIVERASCENCRHRLPIKKRDYSKNVCVRTDEEGFACTILECDTAVWMVGLDPAKYCCECWEKKAETEREDNSDLYY